MRENFGIDHLRPGQAEVIDSVLQRRHTLAIMPTGAGKSLCYQLPALDIPGATVIVSPLISLMKDQVDKLADAGLGAIEINSTLNQQQQENAWHSLRTRRSEFIFTTPEQLMNADFIAMLNHNRIGLFVIDEAHCISQWGHDFRPAYLQMGAVIAALGNPTVLALTATAPDQVVDDIIGQLGLPDMRIINTGIYRPNLTYNVVPVTSEDEKRQHVLRLVRESAGSGIVYAATVKAVDELHQVLIEAGQQVTRYHGQLPAKERAHNQDAFMAGEIRIMVATNAFGMGIDKPDIRFVIHYQMPANLNAYYQESGRAGRDQMPAACTLLYHAKDKRIQNFFLARRYPAANEVGTVYETVQSFAGDGPVSFAQIAAAVDELPEGRLQVALKLLQDGGMLQQDQQLKYLLTGAQASSTAIATLADAYRDKSERDRQALERMVFYSQTGFCRWKVLLEYFTEDVEWDQCQSCDNCREPPAQRLAPVAVPQPAAKIHAEPDACADFEAGCAVRVAKYGEGRVVSTASDQVTVVFPDSRTRTFLRQYVAPA